MPHRLTQVVLAVAALLAWTATSEAKVTKIVIDARATTSAAFCPPGTPAGVTCTFVGDAGRYETLTGRAFGELDPFDPQNALITDIALAPRNANQKVAYIASFYIVKPIDMTKASGLLWHDVPNRGGRITITSDLRNLGDVGLSSGWQGDNAGATAVPGNASSPTKVTPSNNEWVETPVLPGVTGRIFGRIINRSGLGAAPLNVMGNPIPYFPLDPSSNTGATLTIHTKETINGFVTEAGTVPNTDWKFCGGPSECRGRDEVRLRRQLLSSCDSFVASESLFSPPPSVVSPPSLSVSPSNSAGLICVLGSCDVDLSSFMGLLRN